MKAQQRAQRNPVKFFFEGLPKPLAYGAIGVFFAGWLAGMTAFPDLSHGNPTHSPLCRWPLENHGTITCVSHAAYRAAGAAEVRAGSGVLMGFFVMHLGVAAASIARRRRAVGGGPSPKPCV
jgi:hypothetical protein